MHVNRRSVFLIVAALVIAGATAMLARSWLNAGRSPTVVMEAPAPVQDTQILVAARNLPAGRILQEGDLRWQVWADVKLPDTYVRRGRGSDMNDFHGGVVRTGIRIADPVTRPSVVKTGDRGFMAAVLTPGMRAVSIRVNPTLGVAGFVFPGDRVDLILSHRITIDGDDRQPRASETMLQNVRVLAIDQRSDDQATAPSVAQTVTLEVTAKQAETVILARDMGDLSLSLRSLGDPALADTEDNGTLDRGPAVAGDSHTWDSEVSRLLARGGTGGPSLSVMRGGRTERVSFGDKE